jgi:hypothetical protein
VISNLVKQGVTKLTPQQLTDLALKADQDRRRAEAAGNADGVAEYLAERDRLLDLARNS